MPLTRRRALEVALLSLTDEAFGYVALSLWPRSGKAVWPDGRGGFMPESQAGIAAVETAATAFVTDPDKSA
jgi:hypothetical protein